MHDLRLDLRARAHAASHARAVAIPDAASPGAHPAPVRGVRRAAIVAAYVTLFWGALPLALWRLGLRYDAWLGLPRPSTGMRLSSACACAVVAWPLCSAMWVLCTRGLGLPISHLPPSRLVTSGPYARVRHPIYVRFTLAWLGGSLALGSWGAAAGGGLVLTLGWIAYATAFEEPRLVRRFGPPYARYAAHSALLLPLPRKARAALLALWRALAPAFERLANRPVLVRGRGVALVTYGAFVALGAAVMTAWTAATLIPLGVAPSRFFAFALALCAAMLVGGRLLGLLYRPRLLASAPLAALRTVGFVSWGGYTGLALAAFTAAHALGLPFGAVLDRLMLPSLAASALGRLGCLSYGCCGGRPSAHGLRVTHPDTRIVRELGAAACVPRLPTQLLSGAWALCVLALLLLPSTRPLPAGVLAASGALLYTLGRLAVEQTREEARFGRLDLTRGQYAALAVAALSLCWLLGPAAAAVPGTPVHPGQLRALWAGMPAALAVAALCLLVTGLHGRRIGSW